MSLNISFENQWVLITGATRGIGKALAQEFFSCGGNIIITGTDRKPPKWAIEFKSKSKNQDISYIKLDFTSKNWNKNLEKLLVKYPNISVVINNAGNNIISDIREVKKEDISTLVEINLIGPAMLTSVISRSMAEKKYGRIVNISSIFGIVSRKGRSSYSSTKSGLIGLTRACALDLAEDNVLVNCVCPGFTKTELTKRILGNKGINEISKQIPLGRLAEPGDIVPIVLFLSSKLNTYITGQTITVDGGFVVT